eukprot:5894750-Lingulodinium_polyedra.AAC.1
MDWEHSIDEAKNEPWEVRSTTMGLEAEEYWRARDALWQRAEATFGPGVEALPATPAYVPESRGKLEHF